jgi:hypothetical protein
MKKLAIILVIFLLASCEVYRTPPNITINNSFLDGTLTVWNLDIEQNIVYEPMAVGATKELRVPVGNYSVRLMIDCNIYPGEYDRIFFVLISSEYTFCEMTFRKQ